MSWHLFGISPSAHTMLTKRALHLISGCSHVSNGKKLSTFSLSTLAANKSTSSAVAPRQTLSSAKISPHSDANIVDKILNINCINSYFMDIYITFHMIKISINYELKLHIYVDIFYVKDINILCDFGTIAEISRSETLRTTMFGQGR